MEIRQAVEVGAVVAVLAAASVSWGEPARDKTLKVATSVARATVYREGAQVTRQGRLVLDEGRWTVTVPELPTTADPGSLRVTLTGARGGVMHNVQLRTVLGAEEAEQRTREMRRRIRALSDKRAVIQDRVTARQYELDLLRGTRTGGKKGVDTDKVQDWKNMAVGAEAMGKRIHELLAANRTDSLAIRDLDDQIGLVNRQIALSGSLAKDTTALDIELTTAARGEVTFNVSYVVREASWRATYDLALDSLSATQHLDVALVGEVMQRTGEDWQGTVLTVSTERPAFLAVPVPPQHDYRTDYRKRKKVSLPMSADGRSSAAATAAPEPEDTPLRFEGARTVAGEYATRFKVASPVVIKSGAEYRRVALLDTSLACRAAVVIVPATQPTAVLEARATFIGEQPLLPGRTQLYRDGEFVGNGQLDVTLPGEELKVAFGTDAAVRVARKAVNPGRKEGGFNWPGTVTHRFRWETTLKSGHTAPWTVEVQEQLPQSDDPNVRIVAVNLSDGLLEDDPEKPGLKRWKVALEPGKSRKIVFEYTVRQKKGKGSRVS